MKSRPMATMAMCILMAVVLSHSFTQTPQAQHERRTVGSKPEATKVWEYSTLIARARAIGLARDRSQTGWLIDQLKHPPVFAMNIPVGRQPDIGHSSTPTFHYRVAILTALGRIGDPRAIPEIEAFRASLDTAYAELLKPWIDIAIARIRAEAAVPHPRSLSDWQRKLQIFLQAAGLFSYEYVETILSEGKRMVERSKEEMREWILAAIALNCLADMACKAYANGVAEAPQVVEALLAKGNAFGWEYAPTLRLRLCRMSPAERVKWLFETIMSHQIVTTMICYEVQAFVDEGSTAWTYLQAQLAQRIRDSSWSPTPREQRLWGWLLGGFPREWTQEMLDQLSQHPSEAVQWIVREVQNGYKFGSPDVFASDW